MFANPEHLNPQFCEILKLRLSLSLSIAFLSASLSRLRNGALEYSPYNFLGVEELLGKRTRSLRVLVVVCFRVRQSRHRLFWISKAQQSFVIGQETTRTGMLYHNGLAARQVA